jgi:hypothetical protein
MGGDGGPPDSSPTCPTGKKVIFVSSRQYTGNLGGLDGADAKCQQLASSAGLCGTFKAWLSDRAHSASSRLTHASVPYVHADGVRVVANDWARLVSGTLLTWIDTDEKNGVASEYAWTDTTTTGDISTDSCEDWTLEATTETGRMGATNQVSSAWTEGGWVNCSSTVSLYCVQQ